MIESNAQRLERSYALWSESLGAQTDQWYDLVGEDFELFSAADGAETLEFTGRCCGKHELSRYLDGLREVLVMNHFTVHDILEKGDVCTVICNTSWTAKSTGKTFEIDKVDIWRFRDGLAVSFQEIYDPRPALALFV